MPQPVNREEEIIKKFIKERRATPQLVLKLAEKLSTIATITPAGDVSIERECSIKDSIAAIMIARFLGDLLKTKTKVSIKAEVSVGEAAKYANTDKFVASARLKDLKDKGLLDSPSRGIFKVRSISQAERWIDVLHKKYFKKGGD